MLTNLLPMTGRDVRRGRELFAEIVAARGAYGDLDARLDSFVLGSGGATATTLTANALTSATSLTVADITGFADGDIITITLDDGSLHPTTVNGTPSGSTINVDDALPSQASSGNVVSKTLEEVRQGRGDYATLGDRLNGVDKFPGAARLKTAVVSTDTTVTLRTIPTTLAVNSGWLVIDPLSADCEIREIGAVSGADITVAALDNAHAVDTPILYISELRYNVKLFGAKGDDSTNDSAAFQAALDAAAGAAPVVIPVGTYRVKDLSPPAGTTVICHRGAVMKGTVNTDYIFVTSGSLDRMDVYGGEWQDCGRVWSHTTASALALSFFAAMDIHDVEYGFYLTSAVGIHWDGCIFGNSGAAGNLDYGIYLENSGASNINTIRRCRFRHWNNYAIYFNEGSATNLVLNMIEQNWFEQATGGGAIFSGNYTMGLTIERNFFEECGDASTPDITINASSAICRFWITNNRFSPSTSGQVSHRVYVDGNTSGVIERNTVSLKSGETFVLSDHFQPNTIWLHYNYLNATGGGDYLSRLSSNTSSGHVNYNRMSSGGATGDDDTHIHETGSFTQEFNTLANNDTTPSVSAGDLWTCGNAALTTITDFDDGREGQRIEIHFTNGNTTVSDNANIVLAGSANWNPAATDTLTLRLRSGVWYEVNRSDNS